MYGFRFRRLAAALGVTHRNVRKVALKLRQAGKLPEDRDEAVEVVLDTIIQENAEEWDKALVDPGIDWETLLELIYQIIQLVVRIILLF